MTDSNQPKRKALENGAEIIERFGGIRPMAKKIDTPVTTIQGWKKRDTIPAGRTATIIRAAHEHGVDLTGLVPGFIAKIDQTQTDQSQADQAEPDQTPESQTRTEPVRSQEQGGEPKSQETQKSARPAQRPDTRPAHKAAAFTEDHETPDASQNAMDYAIKQARLSAVKTSTLAGGVALLVIVVLFTVMLWPTKKQVAEYEQTIAELETKVDDVKKDQSLLKRIIPDNIEQEFDDLKTQATDLKQRVDNIAEQTKSFVYLAETLLDPENGDLFLRLAKVEEQLGGVGGASDLSTLLRRLDSLQQSVEGQEQMAGSVSNLNDLLSQSSGEDVQAVDLAGNAQDVDEAQISVQDALTQATEEDEVVQKTLAGVPQTDLKAAAYLLALTKFRGSLNRDKTPFNEDLELLQKLVGDDPQMQDAINRLAPRAAQGVLTPEGLSGEFKGLTGDIIVSSLKGEDVELSERAKARLNDFVTIKKDGEQVTGTETQIKVAQAQALLDDGDVAGAMEILQTLEGDAAQTAQPFMEQAELTLDAQNLEKLLTGKLLKNLSSGKFKFTPKAIEDLGASFGQDGALNFGESGDFQSLFEQLQEGGIQSKKDGFTRSFRNVTAKGKNLGKNLNPEGLVDGAKNALPGSRKLIQDTDSGFGIMAPQETDVPGMGAIENLGETIGEKLGGSKLNKKDAAKPIFIPESAPVNKDAQSAEDAGRIAPESGQDIQPKTNMPYPSEDADQSSKPSSPGIPHESGQSEPVQKESKHWKTPYGSGSGRLIETPDSNEADDASPVFGRSSTAPQAFPSVDAQTEQAGPGEN